MFVEQGGRENTHIFVHERFSSLVWILKIRNKPEKSLHIFNFLFRRMSMAFPNCLLPPQPQQQLRQHRPGPVQVLRLLQDSCPTILRQHHRLLPTPPPSLRWAAANCLHCPPRRPVPACPGSNPNFQKCKSSTGFLIGTCPLTPPMLDPPDLPFLHLRVSPPAPTHRSPVLLTRFRHLRQLALVLTPTMADPPLPS